MSGSLANLIAKIASNEFKESVLVIDNNLLNTNELFEFMFSLADALKTNTTIQKLLFEKMFLSSEDPRWTDLSEKFTTVFQENKTLMSLSWKDGTDFSIPFLQALNNSCRQLHTLSFEDFSLSFSAVEMLNQYLEKSVLMELCCRHVELNSQKLQALENGLKENKQLCRLDLSNNNNYFLPSNKTEGLNNNSLSNNEKNIGDNDVDRLLKAIDGERAPIALILSGNGIDFSWVNTFAQLTKMLGENTCPLSELRLFSPIGGGITITKESVESLGKTPQKFYGALEKNRTLRIADLLCVCFSVFFQIEKDVFSKVNEQVKKIRDNNNPPHPLRSVIYKQEEIGEKTELVLLPDKFEELVINITPQMYHFMNARVFSSFMRNTTLQRLVITNCLSSLFLGSKITEFLKDNHTLGEIIFHPEQKGAENVMTQVQRKNRKIMLLRTVLVLNNNYKKDNQDEPSKKYSFWYYLPRDLQIMILMEWIKENPIRKTVEQVLALLEFIQETKIPTGATPFVIKETHSVENQISFSIFFKPEKESPGVGNLNSSNSMGAEKDVVSQHEREKGI